MFGHSVAITWDDGKLFGNGCEVAVTPTGPFSLSEHLTNRHSALVLIGEAFDTIEDITGDDPGYEWVDGRIY